MLVLFLGLGMSAFLFGRDTPQVPNHNTQYCMAAPTRSSPKQERVVSVNKEECTIGTTQVAPSKQLPLSERKAK